MTDIDLSKIQPGDLVKIDIRVSPDMEWLPVKGWREVVQERDALCVDEYAIAYAAGAVRADLIRVRAHKPAPTAVPTEPGTRFRATVRGVPDQVVIMAVRGRGMPYLTVCEVDYRRWHSAEDITDVRDVVLP